MRVKKITALEKNGLKMDELCASLILSKKKGQVGRPVPTAYQEQTRGFENDNSNAYYTTDRNIFKRKHVTNSLN